MAAQMRTLFVAFVVLWASIEAAKLGSSIRSNSSSFQTERNGKNPVAVAKHAESPFQATTPVKRDKRAVSLSDLDRRVTALEERVTLENNYALLFSRRGTSDYITVRGMPRLTAFTVCFWMVTADQGNSGVPVSYASSSEHNEIFVYNYRDFELWIGGEARRTGVSANDGKWHHICATWENRAGSWKFYKDGYLRKSGYGLRTGHPIRSGGILILGQDQDSLGGSFDASQCFLGEMSGVNIWNRVLSASVIYRMSKSCLSGEGNVFEWAEFKAHIRGQVQVIAPSSCRR